MKRLLYVLAAVLFLISLFWWGNSFSYPIICNTRGCVTHKQFVQERTYAHAFAKLTGSPTPSDDVVLTTLFRRHLIIRNKTNTSVPAKDAIAYRQSILHFTDEEKLRELEFSSFGEYDEKVTVPFLTQAAYMEEHNIEETKAAYIELSKNMLIVSFLPNYAWNKETAQMVGR